MSCTKQEMDKALRCLFIAVEESVAKDVCHKVYAHIATLEAENQRLTAQVAACVEELEVIAGIRKSADNLLGYSDHARMALANLDTECDRLREIMNAAIAWVRHQDARSATWGEDNDWLIEQLYKAVEAPDGQKENG